MRFSLYIKLPIPLIKRQIPNRPHQHSKTNLFSHILKFLSTPPKESRRIPHKRRDDSLVLIFKFLADDADAISSKKYFIVLWSHFNVPCSMGKRNSLHIIILSWKFYDVKPRSKWVVHFISFVVFFIVSHRRKSGRKFANLIRVQNTILPAMPLFVLGFY